MASLLDKLAVATCQPAGFLPELIHTLFLMDASPTSLNSVSRSLPVYRDREKYTVLAQTAQVVIDVGLNFNLRRRSIPGLRIETGATRR